jgi:large subunit ribosomal protein L13
MSMNKAFYPRKEDVVAGWSHIDAEGKVLGRLATFVADRLRGKDKPHYTPHTDCGDYVVITNADKIVLSGDKWEGKEYVRVTGWIGGKKETSAKDLHAKHPTRLIELAVKRMLPKNKLSRQMIKKLKIYAGSEHPHVAQNPTFVELDIQKPRG